MTVDIMILCERARREAVLRILRRKAPDLTLERLDALMKRGPYAATLRTVTAGEIRQLRSRRSMKAVLREVQALIADHPGTVITSRYLRARFDIPRWTAQAIVLELARLGLVRRKGKKTRAVYYVIRRSTKHGRRDLARDSRDASIDDAEFPTPFVGALRSTASLERDAGACEHAPH